jgi:hypothetical protein
MVWFTLVDEVVVVELADQLPFDRADLFADVLEVRMQVSKLHRRGLVANIASRLGDTRPLQDDGVEVVLTKRSR